MALKVLKPELAAMVGGDRFLTEIKTTANLQHPHILPLLDSGKAGGFLFYVMPYVQGETLRDRLDREKQLPVEEGVRIAIAVAASDIYSLGCVLYEMRVGEPPYLGNTTQAILGRIISGAPVAPVEQRSSIPPNVNAAILKALERLPADRFASAHDLVEALKNPAFRRGAAVPTQVGSGGRSWKGVAMGTAALSAILAGVLVWTALKPDPPPPVERFSLSVPEAWRPSGQFQISPDGSAIVFQDIVGGSSQLLLRRLENLAPSPVPGTENGAWPAFSPDGREVAFVAGGELRVAPLQGGVVRTVADEAVCCVSGP